MIGFADDSEITRREDTKLDPSRAVVEMTATIRDASAAMGIDHSAEVNPDDDSEMEEEDGQATLNEIIMKHHINKLEN